MSNVLTGKVRLSYAHIWESVVVKNAAPKYSVSLIIPKSDKLTVIAIKKAIEEAKEKGKSIFGGKLPANLKLPLRDGDIERPDDEAYANSYFINARSSDRPVIVDRNKQEIIDRGEVYSGCYARAVISFYPYNHDGNKGIGCGFSGIQKIADGEPLDGRVRAEDVFTVYEDDADDDFLS